LQVLISFKELEGLNILKVLKNCKVLKVLKRFKFERAASVEDIESSEPNCKFKQ
jgi:hypothetical protein